MIYSSIYSFSCSGFILAIRLYYILTFIPSLTAYVARKHYISVRTLLPCRRSARYVTIYGSIDALNPSRLRRCNHADALHRHLLETLNLAACEGKPRVYCNYLVPMYKNNQVGEREGKGTQ